MSDRERERAHVIERNTHRENKVEHTKPRRPPITCPLAVSSPTHTHGFGGNRESDRDRQAWRRIKDRKISERKTSNGIEVDEEKGEELATMAFVLYVT